MKILGYLNLKTREFFTKKKDFEKSIEKTERLLKIKKAKKELKRVENSILITFLKRKIEKVKRLKNSWRKVREIKDNIRSIVRNFCITFGKFERI